MSISMLFLKITLVERNDKKESNHDFLEERILKDGIVKEGNVLKVDSFLNHQMDINLFKQMGEEFNDSFADKEH